MKIDSYAIGLASRHAAAGSKTAQETLRMWVGSQRPDFENAGRSNTSASDASPGQVAISKAGRVAAAQALAASEPGTPQNTGASQETHDIQAASEQVRKDPRLSLLIRVVEALTGQQVRLLDTSQWQQVSAALDVAADQSASSPTQAPSAGWGMEYDYHEVVRESEQTQFQAQGVVHTADGKALQFELSLQMQREYHYETHVSMQAGDGVRKDPLVINFGGTAAELTGLAMDFDIDADGIQEKIRFLGSASGFLALDRNGNGRIDDGSELFGTRSGNGFSDLAAYDKAGNGWIDESDPVFAQLRIWTQDATGQDHLGSLAEHGVGALYLGHASTPFDLKDSQNTQHGQIISTGVYLKEDGSAGTLQQTDLVVQGPPA